jgi:hypothetical protein
MPRLRLAVACAGVAAVVLTACGGGGAATPEAKGTGGERTTTSKPTKSATPPPAPKAGECRELTYADISRYSNDSPVKPCVKRHTSYTFAVEQLPDDVAFDGVQIANDAVQRAAADACQKSFASFVGGDTADRALTRLTVTYFVPTQAGFNAGARWVRCDSVALQSANALAPLPQRLEGFLDKDAASDYDVCSRGDPASVGSPLVMCTQDHSYRAVAAIRLGDAGAPYPGEQAALSDGKQRCEDTISALLGIAGGFTYSWTYPSASDWSDGQRFGYCWNQTQS